MHLRQIQGANLAPLLRMPKPRLITICGATATGKSGLALEIARRMGSPILSADSRQVYREFDIGTAKPTTIDRQLVPHYLIDICDPTETLTVADYQQQAREFIEKFHLEGIAPLLVGGTGLYVKAITRGLKIPRVPPNLELRSQLAQLGQPHCYEILQQVDGVAAQKIDSRDPTRTLRALEVFYTTGLPISQLQGENPPDYPIVQIGLDCDRAKLDDRIRRRVGQMLEMGWVAEVETLCRKYGADLPLLATLGYAQIKRYLAGDISLAEATELTVLHTRQFAKRQRTWFRRYSEIQWFDADRSDLVDVVWSHIG